MRASRAWVANLALRAGLVLSLVIAGLMVGWVVGTLPAHACSCVMGNPAQQFAGAEAVFLGEVVSREKTDSDWQRLYTIEVTRVFKGDVAPVQEVVAVWDNGGSCGIRLPKAGSVLIIGSTEENVMAGPIADGQYGTWGCSGSARATSAPASYGEGWPVKDEPVMGSSGAIPTVTTPASDPWMPFVVGSVVLVLVAGLGAAVVASRRRPGDAPSE
jgi:hypothetical protein